MTATASDLGLGVELPVTPPIPKGHAILSVFRVCPNSEAVARALAQAGYNPGLSNEDVLIFFVPKDSAISALNIGLDDLLEPLTLPGCAENFLWDVQVRYSVVRSRLLQCGLTGADGKPTYSQVTDDQFMNFHPASPAA